MASSSSSNRDTERKQYPARNRIQSEKAIASIVNWMGNDDEDFFSDFEVSSEDEFEQSDDDSSTEDTTTPGAVENPSLPASPETPTPPDIVDQSENLSKKRKRGRPSLVTDKQNDNDIAMSNGTPSSNKNIVNKNKQPPIDIWKEVVTNSDSRKHEFRFLPKREPGVHANLDGDSTPLDCFTELFDDEVQEQLILFINSYAEHVLSSKFPATRGSRFGSWYPVSKYELLKFLALLFPRRFEAIMI